MADAELAVIVTTYQMPGHLRLALESIACQRTRRRIEVVVADDGSTDETPRVVAEFAARAAFSVRFVTHPHTEFHPGKSRNDGARHSTAPHLLFVDGDCVLPPDHLETHLRLYRPGVATCGYCVRLDETTSSTITPDTIRDGSFVNLAPREEINKLRWLHRKSLVYNLIGHPTKPAFKSTDFALSRADYERVNGFDEVFQGWGCEDDDFGRRLKRAGVKLVSVLHQTRVLHQWHPPAPSKPATWRDGPNVRYLGRPVQLTRCLSGLARRMPRELTIRLTGEPHDRRGFDRLLKRHGWKLEFDARMRADLEVMPWPGAGRFHNRGDCRVLVVLDESRLPAWSARRAHVVLSPSGQAGRADQFRLRLDDEAGLWRVLQGQAAARPLGRMIAPSHVAEMPPCRVLLPS
jgi:GT2 family glycosyltransferase